MFQVAYATNHNEHRLSDAFATLDETRKKACALLAEHGGSLVLDIRMGNMVLIGDCEIHAWCAERTSA